MTAGIEMLLRSGKRVVARMTVGNLPPRPQALLLKPGDRIEVANDNCPGRPARFDTAGKLLDPAIISCMLPEVFSRVKAGERIFFDDGRIGGVIRHVGHGRMRVEIVSAIGGAAKLGSEKGAWFKNGPFRVTRTSELLPSEQWNFSVSFVIPRGDMPPVSQARCG